MKGRTWTSAPRLSPRVARASGLLLSVLSCAFLAGAVTADTKLASTPQTEEFPIIDAHIHTHFSGKPERTSGIPDSREQLLKEMKANRVVGAIAHLDSTAENFDPKLLDQGVTFCLGLPANPDLKFVEAFLKSKKGRCLKVYLGYVHQFANHPNYRKAYQLAQKYHVPVVFHTGDTYSKDGKLKYADPLTIDEVAVDFRKVNFVIAHVGNPWIQSAAEVAYKNPNVYIDGSALLIGDLSKTPEPKVDELLIKPISWTFTYLEDPSKLMYGTDWPLTDMASYLAAFKRAIPKEHWRAVFHDNAARVFQLK
jgi:hypothetical protein